MYSFMAKHSIFKHSCEANSTVDARLAVVSAEVRITEQVDSDRQASRGSFKVNRRVSWQWRAPQVQFISNPHRIRLSLRRLISANYEINTSQTALRDADHAIK